LHHGGGFLFANGELIRQRWIGSDETVCQPARTEWQRLGRPHHTVARRDHFRTPSADVGNEHGTSEVHVCCQAAERQCRFGLTVDDANVDAGLIPHAVEKRRAICGGTRGLGRDGDDACGASLPRLRRKPR
jgi:hypothetical protein